MNDISSLAPRSESSLCGGFGGINICAVAGLDESSKSWTGLLDDESQIENPGLSVIIIMKSAFTIAALAATAAAQSIPPAEFGLPVAQNNTQLGVAFFTGNSSAVVQPGILFGKQGKSGHFVERIVDRTTRGSRHHDSCQNNNWLTILPSHINTTQRRNKRQGLIHPRQGSRRWIQVPPRDGRPRRSHTRRTNRIRHPPLDGPRPIRHDSATGLRSPPGPERAEQLDAQRRALRPTRTASHLLRPQIPPLPLHPASRLRSTSPVRPVQRDKPRQLRPQRLRRRRGIAGAAGGELHVRLEPAGCRA